MALRADQWMLLGIVALGGTAAYLLTRASNEASPRPPGEPPRDPQQIPTGTVTVPAAFPPAVLLGDPMRLENSHAYRGRIELPTVFGQPLPSRADVEARLRALGFEAVRVFETPQEADPALARPQAGVARTYPSFSLSGATPHTRWFYGRWLQRDAALPRPADMVLIWDDSRVQAQRVIDRVGLQAILLT